MPTRKINQQWRAVLHYFLLFLAKGRIEAFSLYQKPSIQSSMPSVLPSIYYKKSTRLFATVVDESIKVPKDSKSIVHSKKNAKEKDQNKLQDFVKFPKKAVEIYTDYVKLLWSETSTAARERITKQKASSALQDAQNLILKHLRTPGKSMQSEEKLREACEVIANVISSTELESSNNFTSVDVTTADIMPEDEKSEASSKPKNKSRSVLFGAMMGLCATGWVFSGNYIFTGIFTSMTILGQLEYYRMVMNTGIYPARKISVIGASSMFLTALFAPNLHQICLPMFGLWAMVWFLTMKRKPTTIPEIATTFAGMFYLGYVPSFWVRTRLFGAELFEPTRLASMVAPMLNFLGRRAENLPSYIPRTIHSPITAGSVFIFWTWLCIAFSDVGAYFVGRKYGKTKLGEIFPAAGATSPNKSLEGYLGGSLVSAGLGVIGAWVQKWPYWAITGALHGTLLALLGLIGDLTASMLKRDAGLKDFGNIIPEHGGIMDRVDSFVWSAPYSFLVCVYFIPFLRKVAGM
mmetsp:Transcript_3865/g.6050  ORF Transcript_3865/g.6050 Transcript_3865/m.6050 type:complete len:519 (+) Transcript_3865:203-1759(+)